MASLRGTGMRHTAIVERVWGDALLFVWCCAENRGTRPTDDAWYGITIAR